MQTPKTMKTLQLSKRVPARTRTLTAKWCKRDFRVMDQKYRDIRAKMGKAMDACHWCGHKIADGEMMGLACFTEGGNKILCQPCAGELLASTSCGVCKQPIASDATSCASCGSTDFET